MCRGVKIEHSFTERSGEVAEQLRQDRSESKSLHGWGSPLRSGLFADGVCPTDVWTRIL